MIHDIKNIVISFFILFALSALAKDRSSHMIKIRFIKPIFFDVADSNEPISEHFSIIQPSNQISKLKWNHPIPDKKVTVALESRHAENFMLGVILGDVKSPKKQIQISKSATELFLPDCEHAGLINLHYHSDELQENPESYKIAYTITDAI